MPRGPGGRAVSRPTRRSFLLASTGSTSRGILCTDFFAGQEGAERLSEFRADPGRPQRGWIEPDLDAAPLGVHDRTVIRPDPEPVHGTRVAKVIEPQLHPHGPDPGDR